MVAAQHALSRATKTLAAMPRLKQQRQRFLQQPQKLVNFHLKTKDSILIIFISSREIL